jgi:hypothetical protein
MSKLVRSRGVCDAAALSDCGGFLQDNHVLPKSHYPALRWDIINHIPLCYKHHIFWWHKNPIEATEWFQRKFADRYHYLMSVRNNFKKFTYQDYQEILRNIKEKNVRGLVMFPS